MNHNFIPSIHNGTTCAKCRKPSDVHGDKAECEVCSSIGPVDLMYGSILMCQSCYQKELDLQTANNKPEVVAARLNEARLESLNRTLIEAKEIDESNHVSSDLFNADTITIIERKKAIDSNDSIENKPYYLANELIEQFRHNKQVIFDKNDELVKLNNQQKAIQVYLNNLANQLRQKEREDLRITDITYQPDTPKITRVKAPSTAKQKLDMPALKKAASELGVSVMFVQQFVVQRNCSVEEASKIIRQSIEAAKSSVQ